jgi:hypothetical protein
MKLIVGYSLAVALATPAGRIVILDTSTGRETETLPIKGMGGLT